jgi:hypothetical protein
MKNNKKTGIKYMQSTRLCAKPKKQFRFMDKIRVNTSLDFKLAEGLIFKILIGVDYFHGNNFTPAVYP